MPNDADPSTNATELEPARDHDRLALDRFCAAALEACWLAALVVAPLIFNLQSARVFEPEKVAAVRMLALLAGALLALRAVRRPEPGLARLASLARRPMVAPATALLAAYALSTYFSIEPSISLWGSYARSEGLYTMLSYAVLGVAVALDLRRPEQIERLVAAILLSSFAVSLYAILQHLHLDPVPWAGDSATRTPSTLGNPIFAGGYLVMAAPLAATRLVQLGLRRRTAGTHRYSVLVAAYALVLAAQLLAIWFTGSRGPWAGLAAGLALWAALSTVQLRPRLIVGLFGLVAAAFAGLLLLNLPLGPLQPLRGGPLAPVSHLLDSRGATAKVREDLWGATLRMMAPHAPIVDASGQTDSLNGLRPLLGYGPETMYGAFNQFYPPDIAQYERLSVWDRPHNEMLHALYATGVLGAAAYYALFCSFFFIGLRCLGLVTGGRRWVFLGLFLGMGLASALAASLTLGIRFAAPALALGSAAGLFAYLGWAGPRQRRARWSPRGGLMAGLLGGVLAHFVETQTGIAVAATWLELWVFIGAAAALTGAAAKTRREAAPAEQGRSSAWLLCLLVLPLGFDFMGHGQAATWLLFGTTCLVGAVLLCSRLAPGVSAACLALAAGVAVYRWHAMAIEAWSAVVNLGDLPAAAVSRTSSFTIFVAGVAAMVAAGGVVLSGSRVSAQAWRRPAARCVVAAFVCAMAMAYVLNLRPIQADMLYALGRQLDTQGEPVAAASIYAQAAGFDGGSVQLHQSAARALMAIAAGPANTDNRAPLADQALAELSIAERLDPYDVTTPLNVARYWQDKALLMGTQADKPAWLGLADQAWAAALRLAPNNAKLWDDWAAAGLDSGRDTLAYSRLQTSLRVDARYNVTYALLGDLWTRQAIIHAADPARQRHDYSEAGYNYVRAIQGEAAGGPDLASALPVRLGLSRAAYALGDPTTAVQALDNALKLPPAPAYPRWQILRNLAEAYHGAGREADALEAAQAAIAAAPDSSRPALRALAGQIEGTK